MEGVRAFLESSTIHGLTYLSTTRRFVRLFWIITVIGGFTAAGVLIYQSFENWTENPVTTTTETLPIMDVFFPKITVCPPKKTFTDLNYDLMTVGNITATTSGSDLFNELMDNFVEHFQNKDFNDTFDTLISFKEKDRYKNWYKKISAIPVNVLYDWKIGGYAFQLFILSNEINITTYALTGEVTTSYFGEQFDMDKFALDKKFSMSIFSPFNKTMNLTLQFKYDIENNKDAYVRVVCRHKGFSNITDLDKETKNYKLQTIIDKNCEIIYQRHNPTVYFEDLKTKRFTRFNLKWEYCFSSNDTKYMKTFSNLYTVKKSKYFIAIANMVYEANISKHDLMKIVKGAKVEYHYDLRYFRDTSDALEKTGKVLALIFKIVRKRLAVTNESLSGSSKPLYENEISDETLTTAAEIFIYIVAQQQKYWLEWYDVYEKWLGDFSLRRLLSKYIIFF